MVLVRFTVVPAHSGLGFTLAVIDVGSWFTLTTVVFVQPVELSVKVIVAVVPATTPVTVEPEIETFPLAELQVPAPEVLLRVMFDPTHTLVAPNIAGCPFTVTVLVVVHVPFAAVITFVVVVTMPVGLYHTSGTVPDVYAVVHVEFVYKLVTGDQLSGVVRVPIKFTLSRYWSYPYAE